MSRLLRTASAVGTFMYRRGLVRKMGKMQQVLLTTVGRTSGKPRTVQLGAVTEGDGWVLIGSAGGSRNHPKLWGNKGAKTNVTPPQKDEVLEIKSHEITDPARSQRMMKTVVVT